MFLHDDMTCTRGFIRLVIDIANAIGISAFENTPIKLLQELVTARGRNYSFYIDRAENLEVSLKD